MLVDGQTRVCPSCAPDRPLMHPVQPMAPFGTHRSTGATARGSLRNEEVKRSNPLSSTLRKPLLTSENAERQAGFLMWI